MIADLRLNNASARLYIIRFLQRIIRRRARSLSSSVSSVYNFSSLRIKVPMGANVPILGPSAKTAPSRKAVLFNGQILAEAEPGLI